MVVVSWLWEPSELELRHYQDSDPSRERPVTSLDNSTMLQRPNCILSRLWSEYSVAFPKPKLTIPVTN
jgi:hypothetical protein